MKKKVLLSAMLLLAMIMLLVVPTYAKAKPKLSKKKATITVGKTLKLKVKHAKKVKWSSSNKKIATVKKGIVKAKKAGIVIITAKVVKKKLKCKVTVIEKKKQEERTTPFPEAETEQDSDTASAAQTYVCNTNTMKFHYPDCSSVSRMSAKNKLVTTTTREALIAEGYSPCGNCKP